MSVIVGWLRKAGLVQGVDEPLPEAEAEPSAPHATRVVRLEALLTEQVGGDARAREEELAARAGLNASFDEICAAAGIPTLPGEWTVERLRARLYEGYRESVPPEILRAQLIDALAADGLEPEAIVADAVARDAALDLYEAALDERLASADRALREEGAAIQERMRELLEREARIAAEREALAEGGRRWRSLKASTEARWMEALAHLLGAPGGAPELRGRGST